MDEQAGRRVRLGLTAKDRVFPATLANWQLEPVAVAVTRVAGGPHPVWMTEAPQVRCLALEDPRPFGHSRG